MGKLKDIGGERFDMVIALDYDKLLKKWRCLCDCGNYCYKNSSNLRRNKRNGTRESCGCFRNNLDLTGQTFGKLQVIGFSKKCEKENKRLWNCRCECGETKEVSSSQLRRGEVTHCGCFCKYKVAELEGKRFGRLLVLERVKANEIRTSRESQWLCLCDCGNTSIVTTSNLKYNNTTSCGCYQKEIHSGENSHFYKPELTDEERLKIRDVPEYREWKQQVLKRDDYTCQYCGQRGGNLCLHHKNGYHWYREGRHDVNNGVCLCEKCHRDFHLKYGYKNNTEEQYTHWLKSIED